MYFIILYYKNIRLYTDIKLCLHHLYLAMQENKIFKLFSQKHSILILLSKWNVGFVYLICKRNYFLEWYKTLIELFNVDFNFIIIIYSYTLWFIF